MPRFDPVKAGDRILFQAIGMNGEESAVVHAVSTRLVRLRRGPHGWLETHIRSELWMARKNPDGTTTRVH